MATREELVISMVEVLESELIDLDQIKEERGGIWLQLEDGSAWRISVEEVKPRRRSVVDDEDDEDDEIMVDDGEDDLE